MKEYLVEFTTTITVDAENDDDAIDKAKKEIAPNDTINVDQFYIYCNGRNYN